MTSREAQAANYFCYVKEAISMYTVNHVDMLYKRNGRSEGKVRNKDNSIKRKGELQVCHCSES